MRDLQFGVQVAIAQAQYEEGKNPPMLPKNIFAILENYREAGELNAADAALLFLAEDAEVVEYLARAEAWLKRFYDARRFYRTRSQKNEVDHRRALQNPGGWAGPGMLSIAMLIAARGKVVPDEVFIGAGVFKGGSTSCLSPVCREEGIPYIAADTFEGLPFTSGDGIYEPGQFKGELGEVKSYLEALDAADGVQFAKGLFSDSLSKIKKPVAGLFLDTDLYDSSYSALEAIDSYIQDDMILVSDGVPWQDVISDKRRVTPELMAILDFFAAKGVELNISHTGIGNLCIFTIADATSSPRYSANFFHTFNSLLCMRMGGSNLGIENSTYRKILLGKRAEAAAFMLNAGSRQNSYRFAG